MNDNKSYMTTHADGNGRERNVDSTGEPDIHTALEMIVIGDDWNLEMTMMVLFPNSENNQGYSL